MWVPIIGVHLFEPYNTVRSTYFLPHHLIITPLASPIKAPIAPFRQTNMTYVFIFSGLVAFSFLVTVKTDFPLAVGGHGTIFFKPDVPLSGARAWIEVDTPSGWANSTFPHAREVILKEDGSFDLEAIVDDARRRDEISGLRLFLADSVSFQRP